MKIFFLIILEIILLNSFFLFPKVNAEDDCWNYSNLSDYELYKKRVKCICKEYKFNPTVVNLKDNYKKIISKKELNNQIYDIYSQDTTEYSFKKIKKLHQTNMNSIYKCWLLNIQKKSLLLIKNDLIKHAPNLAKKVEWIINSEISKIYNISYRESCTFSKSNTSAQKLILLKQATYETCKYISYLEYLKSYNKTLPNIIDIKKTHYTLPEIAKSQSEKILELDNEIKHIYKIFPLVFHTYSDYENNITPHFLLKILKVDYISLREALHKSLNPINQVVYKISNAMKK